MKWPRGCFPIAENANLANEMPSVPSQESAPYFTCSFVEIKLSISFRYFLIPFPTVGFTFLLRLLLLLLKGTHSGSGNWKRKEKSSLSQAVITCLQGLRNSISEMQSGFKGRGYPSDGDPKDGEAIEAHIVNFVVCYANYLCFLCLIIV